MNKDQLKSFRKELKLSQEGMARRMKISLRQYQFLEHGDREISKAHEEAVRSIISGNDMNENVNDVANKEVVDIITQIERLVKLKEERQITEEEFEGLKRRLLQ